MNLDIELFGQFDSCFSRPVNDSGRACGARRTAPFATTLWGFGERCSDVSVDVSRVRFDDHRAPSRDQFIKGAIEWPKVDGQILARRLEHLTPPAKSAPSNLIAA